MTWTPGTNLGAAIAQDSTAPIYLVKVEFDSGTLYLTTGPTDTIDSQVYTHADIDVNGIAWENNQLTECAIVWGTADGTILGIIGSDPMVDTPVEIWITERMASYSTDDWKSAFQGVIDEARIKDGRVTLRCKGARSQMISPPRVVGPDAGFNFSSKPGTITFFGVKVDLTARP